MGSFSFEQCLNVIEDIEEQTTADETFNKFKTFAYNLGAASVLLGQLGNPIIDGKDVGQFGRTDWPEEYFKLWQEKCLLFLDPVAQYSQKSSNIFAWEDAYENTNNVGKKVLDVAKDFGLVRGFAITIGSATHANGIVSIGYEKEKPSAADILAIELVATHTYHHMVDQLGLEERIETLKLTNRELEIISFVAAGKTNWEVSVILGVSEKTIENHLSNITRKLNANNRAHAVMIGIRSGQIFT